MFHTPQVLGSCYGPKRQRTLTPTLSTLFPQVLEGLEGAQAVGWPAFHKSSVHASPLLYDWDFDGVRDILLATYDGQVLAFKDTVGSFVGLEWDLP